MRGLSNGVNRFLGAVFGMKVVTTDQLTVNRHWINQTLYFQRLFNLIREVPGDIVECGVAWGVSLAQLALLLTEDSTLRHIWGFDSFSGLPHITKEDLATADPLYSVKSKGGINIKEETAKVTVAKFGFDKYFISQKITLVKGWFEDTLPAYRGDAIAFLHLDPDLYESYKTALHCLWPKVQTGGVVSLDAYHNTDILPGCKKAVDEYFNGRDDVILYKDRYFNRYYAVKQTAHNKSM